MLSEVKLFPHSNETFGENLSVFMTEITKLNFENDEMNHSWHCILILDHSVA